MNLDDCCSFDRKVKKADDEPRSSIFLKLVNEKSKKNILPVSSGPKFLAIKKAVIAPIPALIKFAKKLIINLFL